MVCEGEVDVVTSEEQMVANRNPFDLRQDGLRRVCAGAERRRPDFEKAEVGCAAPNIDDEYIMGAVF